MFGSLILHSFEFSKQILRQKMKIVYSCLALLVLISSCSQKSSDNQVFTQRIVATGNTLEEIRFEPDSFSIPSGASVKINLVNQSEHPSMFHNMVICTFGKTSEIGFKGIQAGKKNDFVPPNNANVLANSTVLNPGDSTSFDFTAPSAGKFSYVCTFPGHYSIMKGVLSINVK